MGLAVERTPPVAARARRKFRRPKLKIFTLLWRFENKFQTEPNLGHLDG
jgi:hypothetical protein